MRWDLRTFARARLTTALLGGVVCALGCSGGSGSGFVDFDANIADDGTDGGDSVGLYDLFEAEIHNPNAYSNPFDYRVIDLQATFTHVDSGRVVSYFGFYDGDGHGGQDGDVWKLRFMPDVAGTWNYSWSWTDGTPGGGGTFRCVDTGLPGPLAIATDNSWYFMDARGAPFDYRGYSLWGWLLWTETGQLDREIDNFESMFQERVIDRGYNMIMWPNMSNRLHEADADSYSPQAMEDSFWLDTTDTNRFDVAKLAAYDDTLRLAHENRIYAYPWTLIYQNAGYGFDDFSVFLRYFVARYGAFYNFLGWSATWEWQEVWTAAELNEIMQYLSDIDPWKRLLTSHDLSHSSSTGWLSFTLRQKPARDVFLGNVRRHPDFLYRIPEPNGSGGIGDPFIDNPIIGSEDVWEMSTADNWAGYTVPRNGREARRAAWGVQMAGVLPLYDEWNPWRPEGGGTGEGEPFIRLMFDFMYSRSDYRRYTQLNGLVSSSSRQICSGIPGAEYLVYDENGGSIAIDLSGVPASTDFSVLWYDPATGAEQPGGDLSGGAVRTLASPFAADTVLLLRSQAL